MTDGQFIEATREDGTKAFINLNMVGQIKVQDDQYVLNVLGNQYFIPIDNERIKKLIMQ